MHYPSHILTKARNIKLAIFDVDGVLTNGAICIDENGKELKIFHVHDGLGIKLLRQSGVEVAIISSRISGAVEKRMRNLGIQYVYQGQTNKQHALTELLEKLQLTAEQVAYAGDDLPDLALIKLTGLGISVPNARPAIQAAADWQTQARGGEGAVREICELIMQAQNTIDTIFKQYE